MSGSDEIAGEPPKYNMKDVRKVKDGLGRIWYEGWHSHGRIWHLSRYSKSPCRHRWKWVTTLHVNKAVRDELSREFTDV